MTGAKDGNLLGHVKSKAAAAALPVVRESTFVAFFSLIPVLSRALVLIFYP
jgi:hypothetical protein